MRRNGFEIIDRRFAHYILDNELLCIDPYARGIGATPAIVDPHVAAVSPAQFFKRLPECSYIAPLLGVILGEGLSIQLG